MRDDRDMTTTGRPNTSGDVDVAAAAALLADPTRARVLRALGDGRALAASVLAAEAGVSAPAASAALTKLRTAGVLSVEQSGRHRYYRLADERVATALEALAAMAPTVPVRSLRQHTQAAALRRARTCYDHLAGGLGVAVTEALLQRGALTAVDGLSSLDRRPGDRLSAPSRSNPYALGPAATDVFGDLGVGPEALQDAPPAGSRRPLLRFCIDWSEQRHHLAGRLGADVLGAFESEGWIARRPGKRAVDVTDAGTAALRDRLGLELRQRAA
jgi:DNA-binding transcriptional ArsR family regulator